MKEINEKHYEGVFGGVNNTSCYCANYPSLCNMFSFCGSLAGYYENETLCEAKCCNESMYLAYAYGYGDCKWCSGGGWAGTNSRNVTVAGLVAVGTLMLTSLKRSGYL